MLRIRCTILLLCVVVPFAGNAANFENTVRALAPEVPNSRYQVYMAVPHDGRHASDMIIALIGLCELYEDDDVTGIAIVDDIGLVPEHEPQAVSCFQRELSQYDLVSEGIVVIDDSGDEVLFAGSCLMPMGNLLMVLDRLLATGYSIDDRILALQEAYIDDLVESCALLRNVDTGLGVNICELFDRRDMLIMLPTNCSECSLRRYKTEIVDLCDRLYTRGGTVHVLSFADFNIFDVFGEGPAPSMLLPADLTLTSGALLMALAGATQMYPIAFHDVGEEALVHFSLKGYK